MNTPAVKVGDEYYVEVEYISDFNEDTAFIKIDGYNVSPPICIEKSRLLPISKPEEKRDRWDYTSVFNENRLTDMGKEGWECYGAQGCYPSEMIYFLKRKIN